MPRRLAAHSFHFPLRSSFRLMRQARPERADETQERPRASGPTFVVRVQEPCQQAGRPLGWQEQGLGCDRSALVTPLARRQRVQRVCPSSREWSQGPTENGHTQGLTAVVLRLRTWYLGAV